MKKKANQLKQEEKLPDIFFHNLILLGSRYRANPQEIILLQADINYTQILMTDGSKMTVATSLKKLEKRFAVCPAFFRTHKSFLININYIKNYDAEADETFVQMQNDYRVIISRRKKEAFKERILTISQTI